MPLTPHASPIFHGHDPYERWPSVLPAFRVRAHAPISSMATYASDASANYVLVSRLLLASYRHIRDARGGLSAEHSGASVRSSRPSRVMQLTAGFSEVAAGVVVRPDWTTDLLIRMSGRRDRDAVRANLSDTS
jgi:hypothetical protein